MTIAVFGSALRGGGIQVIDIILESTPPNKIFLYDDDVDTHSTSVLGVPVRGSFDIAADDFSNGIFETAVIAIGSINPRKLVFDKIMRHGIPLCNVISKHALISPFSKLGTGNVFLPYVYIGPSVSIGDNNYFTTGSQINHDTIVGSHCYFSAGVTVAGRVKISNQCRFDTSCSVSADAFVPDRTLVPPSQCFGPVRGI